MRRWGRMAATATLVALALLVGACGGDDDGGDSPPATTPAPETPLGDGEAAPPSASDLPPEFIKCMADRGFEVESSADVHSAPPEVLQQCFGSVHGGSGAP